MKSGNDLWKGSTGESGFSESLRRDWTSRSRSITCCFSSSTRVAIAEGGRGFTARTTVPMTKRTFSSSSASIPSKALCKLDR